MTQGMQETIAKKLAQALQPLALEIVNESFRHHGHAGDDGSGESHFQLTVVSAQFTGKGRIERQRMVYDLLKEEMRERIHALSVKALSPEEYRRV